MLGSLVWMHAHQHTARAHKSLRSVQTLDFIAFVELSHAVVHVAAGVHIASQGDSIATTAGEGGGSQS